MEHVCYGLTPAHS